MAKRGAYKALDLKTKVEILQKLQSGSSRASVMEQYGIKRTTLNTYVKNTDAIMDAWEKNTFSDTRKRMRTAAHPELEEALLLWIKNARSKNYMYPISGPILATKAEDLALRMNIDGFKCSEGWMHRFKERHNIVYRSVCGESASVSDSVCEDWKNRLGSVIEGYEPRNIFNADETGLFFKQLPKKTFALKNDPCSGGKQSKLRITVLLTTNMDGSEKLKPLVIGKAAKPRCFKGIKTLPVDYFANAKSWINGDIYTTWLRKLDLKFKSQKRKILLFVDNASAHVEVEGLTHVKVVFLPACTTAKLQPLDQGIILNFKMHYRRRLLQRVLFLMETDKTYDVTLLSAIHLVVASWDMVTSETIANCFRHAGLCFVQSVPSSSSNEQPATSKSNGGPTSTSIEAENPCPENEWWQGETFSEYVNVDGSLETCGDITDDEIVKMVQGGTNESESEGENEETGPSPPSDIDVANAIDCLVKFITLQDGKEVELKNLLKIEQMFQQVRANKRKQSSITDFFQ